jgi:hypothetical protein
MRNILLLGILLFLTSCSQVYYVSDPAAGLDSNKYMSYGTEEHCDEEVSQLNLQRIKNALDIGMRDIGLERSDRPDLLVKFFVKNKTKKYIEECADHYDRWTGGETCREKVLTYEEGSIVIDFIDTDTNTIVWHGAAHGPSFNTLKKPDQEINRMVSKLIKMYYTEDKT